MKNWKTIAVQPNISMEHAMAKLDQGGLGIVLVIDDKDALIGTVTDGDIRRALLRKLPISAPVAEIMCRTPQVGEGHWSINKMRAVMADSRITQLPVVDARGRVIGIETLHDALTKKSYSNPVFLMAGGFGKRLHPLTNDCPKPMLM
jgi:CBS domain-containing protein